MDKNQALDANAVLDHATSGLWDSALLGLIIAAAMGYLYIKLWRNKGACTSCPTSGPGCSGCGVSAIEFDKDTPLAGSFDKDHQGNRKH